MKAEASLFSQPAQTADYARRRAVRALSDQGRERAGELPRHALPLHSVQVPVLR